MVDRKLAEKIRNISDDSFVDELVEGTFRDLLIEKGLVTEDRFYEISEVYYFLENNDFIDKVEKINANNPVLPLDDRAVLSAMKSLDLSKVKGYFPYVEENGIERLSQEESAILSLISGVRKIGNEIYAGWESDEDKSGIAQIWKGLKEFETYMLTEVAPMLGLSAPAMKLEIQNRFKIFFDNLETNELTETAEPGKELSESELPQNVIKFPEQKR